MISTTEVAISQLDFEKDSIQKLQADKYAGGLWPIVYILSDGKRNWPMSERLPMRSAGSIHTSLTRIRKN
jgi:hypothetical protein